MNYLEQVKKLLNVARENYTNAGLIDLIDRNIAVCVDNPPRSILVTGINPSFDRRSAGEEILYRFADADKPYWKRLHNMLGKFTSQTGYLDLFPFKESVQNNLEGKIPISLSVDLLRLVHQEIERLQPKLIIIHNRKSLAFLGGVEEIHLDGV